MVIRSFALDRCRPLAGALLLALLAQPAAGEGRAFTPQSFQVFGGLLLVAVGVALVTGLWNDFTSWVRDAFVSDVRLPI